MAVVLSDLLAEERVLLELRARTRDDALREIVGVMQSDAALKAADKFLAQVQARETASSTYVGNGVAFPHARSEFAAEMVLGIGRSSAGVPFGDQGARAHLIFLVAVPQRMVTDYLVCMGALARLTKAEATRTALLEAATASELVELLRAGSLLLH